MDGFPNNFETFITARKRSLRRLCFYRCLSFCPQGGCMVAQGGCMVARGGMHGCSWGGCVVAPGGVCVVALGGGHAWLPRGACVVAPGGMHGCFRGVCGCSWGGGMCCCSGGCMVARGMRGCSGGHAWLLWGDVRVFSDETRSMTGRYASYWNAFLFIIFFDVTRFLYYRRSPIFSNFFRVERR